MLCLRLGIGTYGITTQTRRGIDGRMSELHRMHLINEDLIEDFFLIAQHRLRFNACEKQWVRRGWVVRSVEATDRVEEVYCAEVPEEHAFALEDNILRVTASVARRAATRSRSCARSSISTSSKRSNGSRRARGSRCGTTTRRSPRSGSASSGCTKRSAKRSRIYHELLLESPGAGNARVRPQSGLRRRRGAAVLARLRARRATTSLSRHLQNKKFARQDIVDAGLAFVNRAQKLQDQFRGRLMFPIWDARGEPVGFGGRTLDGQGPKYKNSPETPIYQKSRLLYGLHWAKGEIVARGEVVICEGYTDVMAFALARRPDRGRDMRNRPRRRPLPHAEEPRPQGDARVRRRRRRPGRGRALLPVGATLRGAVPGRRPAGRAAIPPTCGATTRTRSSAAVTRATPFLEFRIDRLLAASDLSSLEGRARTARSCGRAGGRTPERSRPRPVRDEVRGSARHRSRPTARDRDARPYATAARAPTAVATGSGSAGPSARRRPARARRVAVGGARTRADERPPRRRVLRGSGGARLRSTR